MSTPISFERGRGQGGSPSPSVTWNFTCGHIIKQEKNISAAPFGGFLFFSTTRSFEQNCPECLEADEMKQKDEAAKHNWLRSVANWDAASKEGGEEVARIKTKKDVMLLGSQARQTEEEKREEEAKAMAKQQEAKSLALYKSQASFIAKQIEDAGDDEQTWADFTTMLKNCKLLWASKVQKGIIAETQAGPAPENSREELQDRLEVELMVERAEILFQRYVGNNPFKRFGDSVFLKKKGEIEAWQAIAAKMKGAMKTYEEKIAPLLNLIEDSEKEAGQAWEEAVKLLKE
ncbi:hypothetical protein N431DRAFT_456433 [Stipitochalara longipes BDJ]|nr:hypothetical protein N431DRAFT_456433 [Stipitochalara longipes BDJ]